MTLLHASMVRSVDSIFPMVRSIMEAREPFLRRDQDPATDQDPTEQTTLRWDDTVVQIGIFTL